MRAITTTILIALLAAAVHAATPPDRINYEGVLRDSADNPVDATHDVVFRLFDAETVGNEMLVDEHLGAGTGGVTFDNGLFNAEIGGGNVLDGSGPGTYTTLRDLFRDYGELWLEIEVNGETLSPRLPVLAAGHAMNADHAEQADNASTLGGLPAGNFLDTSAAPQTKSGNLNVNGSMDIGGTLDVNGTEIALSAGTRFIGDAFSLTVIAGDAPDDDLYLQAGDSSGHGRISIEGEGEMRFESGDGSYRFLDGGVTETARLNPFGDLQIDGSLDFGGTLNASGGAVIRPTVDILRLEAGVDDTDSIWLVAGNDNTDGRIVIQGDSGLEFWSGGGSHSFGRADTGATWMTLSANQLDLDSDLRVQGNDVFFGAGGYLSGFTTSLLLQAGDETFDDLYLQAGSGSTNGRIVIQGNSDMLLESGSGIFSFRNATGTELAGLDGFGNLQIDGNLTVDGGTTTHSGDLDVNGELNLLGNRFNFGWGGYMSASDSSTVLIAGNGPTDDLYLQAGDSSGHGRIVIVGEGNMSFESGNGTYRFLDGGAVETAALNTAGDLQIDGDFTMDGAELRFGDGAWILTGPTQTTFFGGDTAGDNLVLRSSSPVSEGRISLLGGSRIEFDSGNGQYYFYGSSGTNAFIEANGNLDIDGRLDMDGGDIYMVETGSDQTQDIHFREGGLASGERFEWDDAAHRFEVSDDFHAFGSLTATTKNFVQNHPYRDDLEVVYTSLEGDEATAFTRGFGKLESGEARIALGETFAYVVNPDLGLSAHLTPRGEWAELYVAELTADELVVRAAPDAPDVAFDFIVYGLRIGHEDFPVLRPKRAEAFLPPDGAYDEDRGEETELADAAALARYRLMAEQALGATEIDFSRTQALKAAIGQRPVQFDYPVGSDRSVAAILAEENGDGAVDPDAHILEQAPENIGADAIETGETAPAATTTETATVDPDGDVYADSFRPKASELATMLPAAEALSGGDVVAIDPVSGRMVLSRLAADQAVFGVVAAEPGVILGARQPAGETATGELDDVPVAMSGIVLCKVDASYGAIRPGDLLTTSETPGHAMRVDGPAAGTVLGKALEPLDVGTGLVRVLVTLR